MAELKTKVTTASVAAFLKGIEDPARRRDCATVAGLMRSVTRHKAEMWGTSIVGFGRYRYVSPATGRGGDWFVVGFSPRKQALTVYILAGVKRFPDLLQRLGTHKVGGGCLYLKSLDDVDTKVLRQLIAAGVRELKKTVEEKKPSKPSKS